MIERVQLGDGLTMSRVLTGLWQMADQERDGRQIDLDAAAAAMHPYAEAGLTTFDMADHYGSSEIVAGRYRRRPGARPVELFTKWVPSPGRVTATEVRAAVQRALTRMQGDTIDLLQYHAWNYADPSWIETLFLLQDLKREGLIRHLGLTNVDTAHLRMVVASGIEVVSNQVSYSLFDQRASKGLGPYCATHDVKLLAYGTLGGGWLSDRWLGQPEPDWERTGTWSQMKYGRFLRTAGGWEALQRLLRVVRAVADRHGVSIATVASRYILEQPGVAGVIIGARLSERAHIDDTVRLFSVALSAEDHAAIAAAQATLAAIPGDCGDEYRKPPFLTASGDLSHHLAQLPPPYDTRAVSPHRTLCLSGTEWEPIAGYSRATRVGRRIAISGTTATLGSRAIGGDDPAAQMHCVIDKVEGALQSLGARLEDVVRTRVFVKDVGQWEPIARAHGERFGHILPANTMVGAPLIGDEYLVEMEVDAEVPGGTSASD